MKRLLIAAAAMAALSSAAAAQPAYDGSSQPPASYPACTHKGQDRCMQHGGMHHHMTMTKPGAGKTPDTGKPAGGKSSTDGERG